MFTLLRRFALVFGLFVGTLASQLPEFAQQYRQRLGGALDELTRIIRNFDDQAQSQGLTEGAAIDRLKKNDDRLAQHQGESMQDNVIRRDRLADQQDAFRQAGPVGRLGVLARDFDPAIARGAWNTFEPAVPVTIEGLAAGGVGLVAGYCLWHACALPFRRRRPGRRAQTIDV